MSYLCEEANDMNTDINIDIDKMNSILIYSSLCNKYIPISIYENYIHPIHHRTEFSSFLEIKKWMIDIIKYIKKLSTVREILICQAFTLCLHNIVRSHVFTVVQLTTFVFECSVLCRQMLHDLHMNQSNHSTRLASIAERIVDFDDSHSMQDNGFAVSRSTVHLQIKPIEFTGFLSVTEL